MEGLSVVIIMFVIFGFIQKYAKKANQQQKKGASPTLNQQVNKDAPPVADQQGIKEAPPMAAPPAPAKGVAKTLEVEIGKDIRNAMSTILEQLGKEAPGQGQPVREATLLNQAAPSEALPLGESVQDDQGCVGGSLGHHDEEGETHAEHARHVRGMARDERDREEARQTAAALRQVGMAQMRRAVIMAEILDKPKALRRR